VTWCGESYFSPNIVLLSSEVQGSNLGPETGNFDTGFIRFFIFLFSVGKLQDSISNKARPLHFSTLWRVHYSLYCLSLYRTRF